MTKGEKVLNIRVSTQEMTNLEEYCEQTQQTKTSVIREFLRDLPDKDTDKNKSN